jgi:hypothetical protein
MTSILRHTEGSKNLLFVQYETFIKEPDATSIKLCTFLDEQYGVNGDASARVHHMTGAVDPSLMHHRNRQSFTESPLATPEQAGLHAFLQRKVRQPDLPFHPEDYALYRGWREFLLTVNALVDMCNRTN